MGQNTETTGRKGAPSSGGVLRILQTLGKHAARVPVNPKRILNLMQKVSQNGVPKVARKLFLFGGWLPGGPQGAPRSSPRRPRQLFGVIFDVIFVFFGVTSEASLEPFAVPSEAVLDHFIWVLGKP